MSSKPSFIDKILLFFLFFVFDLVIMIPFLLGVSLLTLGTGFSVLLFVIGGAFLSSAIGVNPELFWGDLLGSFNQIFYLFDYFFLWYDYTLVGIFLIFLGLLLISFFIFSLLAFLRFLWQYVSLRYGSLWGDSMEEVEVIYRD